MGAGCVWERDDKGRRAVAGRGKATESAVGRQGGRANRPQNAGNTTGAGAGTGWYCNIWLPVLPQHEPVMGRHGQAPDHSQPRSSFMVVVSTMGVARLQR